MNADQAIGMAVLLLAGSAALLLSSSPSIRRWFLRGPGDQVKYALTKGPDVMPWEPDQAYVLDGEKTAMTQIDWSCGPPYREITCRCGWLSSLAERVLDSLGSEMRTRQEVEARAHFRTCGQARAA